MDGLVYFSDTSTGIPDSAGMNELVRKALTPAALVEALKTDLSELTSAILEVDDEVVDMPSSEYAYASEAPSHSPTLQPQVDVIAGIVEESTPMQTQSSNNVVVLAGTILAGTVALLFGIFLLSLHLKRSKVMTTEWKTEDVQEKQKQLPSPTKTVATGTTEDDDNDDIDIERNVVPTSCIGNLFTTGRLQTQMMEDDLSELDFNVDDLVSDFDDTVSIQPHIIAVEPVESFEHARTHILKKDMLDMSMGKVPYWQGTNDKTHPCALEPTDVSAATLAIKTRSSTRHSSLVPKVSWWAQQPRDDVESGGNTTDFEGGDWDPDDHSIATDDQSAVFSAIVENKDEQSLLQHSLRNESYKMQRLRTPDKITVEHDDHSSSNDDDYDSICIL
jgi:hypothetical protein